MCIHTFVCMENSIKTIEDWIKWNRAQTDLLEMLKWLCVMYAIIKAKAKANAKAEKERSNNEIRSNKMNKEASSSETKAHCATERRICGFDHFVRGIFASRFVWMCVLLNALHSLLPPFLSFSLCVYVCLFLSLFLSQRLICVFYLCC